MSDSRELVKHLADKLHDLDDSQEDTFMTVDAYLSQPDQKADQADADLLTAAYMCGMHSAKKAPKRERVLLNFVELHETIRKARLNFTKRDGTTSERIAREIEQAVLKVNGIGTDNER